jgi:hypothetical protein
MSIGEEFGLRLKKKEKEQHALYMSDAFKEIITTALLKQVMLKVKVARNSMHIGSSAHFDPMTRCISISGEIALDLDDDYYFKVVDIFKDNATMQKAFIKMPDEKRLGWLGRL